MCSALFWTCSTYWLYCRLSVLVKSCYVAHWCLWIFLSKNTKFIKWVWIHFLTVIVPVRSKVVQIWWSVLEWQQFQPITLIAFTPIMIFWVKSLTKITEYSELNSFLFNYNSLLKCLQWANKYKSAQNIFYNSQQNKTCEKKEKTDTFIFVFVSALKKHCY